MYRIMQADMHNLLSCKWWTKCW